MYSEKQEELFVVFSGRISNLRVIFCESNPFIHENNRRIGMFATLGLSAIGESSASVISLQNLNGSEMKLQLFYCQINEKIVYGCFSRVFFENDDDVDVVAEPQEDGSFYAHSVRRPIDHRLWLPVYCERGTKANKRANFSIAMWWASIISCLSFLFAIIWGDLLIKDDLYLTLKYLSLAIISNLFLFLFLFLCIISLLKDLTEHSKLADKIFLAWGYKEPELLDMNKENSLFLKRCKKYGDYYCSTDTKQFNQIFFAPCVYHYCNMPDVRESLKFKE